MRDCRDRHLGGGSDGRAYRSGRLVRRAAYCSGWLLILAAQSFNERPNRAGLMTSEDTDTGRALTKMRWGMPPPPRTGGPPGHQHPQHVVAALAHVAQAGEPLLGPGQ